MEYTNRDRINDASYSPSNIAQLREEFINRYSRTKGWNSKLLSTEQLLEITSQAEYKNPSMMHS